MPKHPKSAIHWAFAQQDLTHFEKLLLVSIAFASENIKGKVTQTALTNISSLSRNAVKKKLKRLEAIGAVKTSKSNDATFYELSGYKVGAE